MEARGAPALQNFLDAVQSSEGSIKRDLEAAGDVLRVMTVHAAKGLEAPIVILPDTMAGEDAGSGPRNAPRILFPPPAHEQIPQVALWPGAKDEQSPALARIERLCAKVRLGEHRRLLYVAMTRAAERLIVCGFGGAKGPPNGSWRAFVESGLGDMLTDEPAPWGEGEVIRALGAVSRAEAGPPAAPPPSEPLPAWLRDRPPADSAPIATRASADAFAGAAQGRAKGRYLHFLLERLSTAPAPARASAAQRVLGRSFGLDETDAAALREKALAMLADPRLAPFFAAGSMGEVAMLSRGPNAMDVRVDRLAFVGDEIWIADFKLGPPPTRAPAAYVDQLAHYRWVLRALHPDKTIRAFLVWSDGDAPSQIAGAELDRAASRAGLKGSP